jgi:carboxylesterase
MISGGKTGVLLLHDLGAPAGELASLAHNFADNGFSVARPQIGANAAPGEQLSGSQLLTEAQKALFALRERSRDVLIVGVSYGAMLGLELARQNRAAVAAVAMVEPRVTLPGLGKLGARMSQARLARWQQRLAPIVSRQASPQVMGLAATGGQSTANNLMFGTGQILDCLRATLPSVRQPVLLIRRMDAPQPVVDTSAMLQRRLGGRVETAILDQVSEEEMLQGAIADRSLRFAAAVTDEMATRRENAERRERMRAGQASAA